MKDDPSLKYKFLYKSVIQKIGLLDDSESFEDSFWYMSAEYDELLENMLNSPTSLFLIHFICLFKSQVPDGNRLLGLFADKTESENETLIVKTPNRKDLEQITVILKKDSDHQVIKKVDMIFKVNLQNSLSEIENFQKTISAETTVFTSTDNKSLITQIRLDLSTDRLNMILL